MDKIITRLNHPSHLLFLLCFLFAVQVIEDETCESDGIELSLVDQMREMDITDNAIAQASETGLSGAETDMGSSHFRSMMSDKMFVSSKVSNAIAQVSETGASVAET